MRRAVSASMLLETPPGYLVWTLLATMLPVKTTGQHAVHHPEGLELYQSSSKSSTISEIWEHT